MQRAFQRHTPGLSEPKVIFLPQECNKISSFHHYTAKTDNYPKYLCFKSFELKKNWQRVGVFANRSDAVSGTGPLI